MLEVSWDPKKARGNLKKHGVTFTEASTVLSDPFAEPRDDEDYPERVVLTGYSSEQRLLVVVHVEIVEENWVRIISACKANVSERKRHSRSRKGDE